MCSKLYPISQGPMVWFLPKLSSWLTLLCFADICDWTSDTTDVWLVVTVPDDTRGFLGTSNICSELWLWEFVESTSTNTEELSSNLVRDTLSLELILSLSVLLSEVLMFLSLWLVHSCELEISVQGVSPVDCSWTTCTLVDCSWTTGEVSCDDMSTSITSGTVSGDVIGALEVHSIGRASCLGEWWCIDGCCTASSGFSCNPWKTLKCNKSTVFD